MPHGKAAIYTQDQAHGFRDSVLTKTKYTDDMHPYVVSVVIHTQIVTTMGHSILRLNQSLQPRFETKP